MLASQKQYHVNFKQFLALLIYVGQLVARKVNRNKQHENVEPIKQTCRFLWSRLVDRIRLGLALFTVVTFKVELLMSACVILTTGTLLRNYSNTAMKLFRHNDISKLH